MTVDETGDAVPNHFRVDPGLLPKEPGSTP